MTVFQIAKWRDTFETAESRKYKTLTWVSIPIGFESNGYQLLLDEFGEDADAIYGAWCALVALAARCNDRGVLATSRGVAIKTSYMARLTGLRESSFQRLIAWASRPDIGWLEDAAITKENDTPEESPGNLPGQREKNIATEPNRTEPNLTLPIVDRLERATTDKDFVRDVFKYAQELSKLPRKPKRETTWAASWIGRLLDRSVLDQCLKKLRDGEVSRPDGYLARAMVKLCERCGDDWDRLKLLVPEIPPEPKPVEQVAS